MLLDLPRRNTEPLPEAIRRRLQRDAVAFARQHIGDVLYTGATADATAGDGGCLVRSTGSDFTPWLPADVPATNVDTAPVDEVDAFLAALPGIKGGVELEVSLVNIFGIVDDLLCEDRISDVGRILDRVNVELSHVDTLVAFLSATAPVPASELPERHRIFAAARRRYADAYGEAHAADVVDPLR